MGMELSRLIKGLVGKITAATELCLAFAATPFNIAAGQLIYTRKGVIYHF